MLVVVVQCTLRPRHRFYVARMAFSCSGVWYGGTSGVGLAARAATADIQYAHISYYYAVVSHTHSVKHRKCG